MQKYDFRNVCLMVLDYFKTKERGKWNLRKFINDMINISFQGKHMYIKRGNYTVYLFNSGIKLWRLFIFYLGLL